MIGFPVGMLYANAGEWFLHRYVLHGAGKKRESLWSFHFHEHHQASRKAEMIDPDYHRSVVGWHAQGKEALGVLGICAIHAPLFPVAPGFTSAVWFTAAMYYRRHKRSHLDPNWAREHMPWHYDHHMGPDQDKNWCVTWPWFDHVMGTREVYAGTEREAADLERRRKREERRKQQAAEAGAAPAAAAGAPGVVEAPGEPEAAEVQRGRFGLRTALRAVRRTSGARRAA